METWLTTKETAELMEVSKQAVLKKIAAQKLKYREDKSSCGGSNGTRYLVALSSLPLPVQRKYYKNIAKQASAETTQHEQKGKAEAIDTSIVDLVALERGWGVQAVEEFSKRLDVVKKALDIEKAGTNVTERKAQLAANNNIEPATLYRWINAYNKHGEVGLLRKNVREELQKPGYSPDREVKSFGPAALDYMTAVFLNGGRSKIKRKYAYNETVKKAAEMVKAAETEEEKQLWRVGSYQSACRYFQSLDPAVVAYAQGGIKELRDKYMPKVLMNWDKLLVNELWFSDHNRADVFVEFEGRAIRPWQTTFIDARSRVITGVCISTQNSSLTIALALRHGALPKEDGNPICGLPVEIYIDNGKDYQSKYLVGGTAYTWKYDYTNAPKGVFPNLDIKVRHALEYRSWSKGIQERWYGTLNEHLRLLPGYCGNSKDNRPVDFDEKKALKNGELISFHEYVEKILEIVNIYNNTYHSKLGDTPLNVYRRTPKAREGIPSPEVFDFILLSAQKRKVSTVGIRLNGQYYYNPQIIGQYGGKYVEVRFDPTDMSYVRVRYKGKYIGTAYINSQTYGDQEALSIHMQAQRSFERCVKDTFNGYLERNGFKTARATGRNNESAKGNMITGFERSVREMQKDNIDPVREPIKQQAVGDEQLPLHIRKMMEVGRKALGLD